MTAGADRPVVAGAAIVDDAMCPTHVYVAQRSYPEALAGLWEFPGGKVEEHESVRSSLQRECTEELGVLVRLLDEVLAPEPAGWPLDNGAVMRVFTAVVVHGGRPAHGPGHLDARWMPLDDPGAIRRLAWIPADRPIVEALLRMLAGRG